MLEHWKHKLPTREKIFASRWFRPFARRFDKPEYWAFSRDKVALSVAIGLFCGMMPAPTQFICALALAYLLRTQVAVALFATLYTNPLTLIPLYAAAYKLGNWLLHGTGQASDLVMPLLHDASFWQQATVWAQRFGAPLAVGVLTMGSVFALAGYGLVQLLWRWRARRQAVNFYR